MSQLGIGRIGTFLLLFHLACATPGYRVFVSARVGEAKEATGMLDRLGLKARAAGYSVAWEGRKSPAVADRVLNCYVKKLSGDRRDSITIVMSGYTGTQPERDEFYVSIVNPIRSDAWVKTEIDLMASEMYGELASLGRGKVTVTRDAAGPPVLY